MVYFFLSDQILLVEYLRENQVSGTKNDRILKTSLYILCVINVN